jgi:hypothetical protein
LYGVGSGNIATAGRRPALAPKLSLFCAVFLATMLAGCARHPDRQPAAAVSAQSRICQSERARLASQPAPDCSFRRSNLVTVDPVQFARLKAAYERQCSQRAEKAKRARLRRLQKVCEGSAFPRV